MYKKSLLRVCILCETPLDTEVSKKLLEYFSTYGLAIRIYIKNIHPTRKVICIPGSLCAPMLNTKLSSL